MSFLKNLLMTLLPFLFSAISKEFNNLPKEQQDALIKAGQFGQIIKDELHNGYAAIVQKAGITLNLPAEQINSMLIALSKEMSINTDKPMEVVDYLQRKVNAGLTDSGWDSLWTTVSGQLAIVISGGKLNWPTIALGLIEFCYQKFIK